MNVHSRTPTLSAHDPRGLPVRTVDYCRTEVVEPAQTRINRSPYPQLRQNTPKHLFAMAYSSRSHAWISL